MKDNKFTFKLYKRNVSDTSYCYIKLKGDSDWMYYRTMASIP